MYSRLDLRFEEKQKIFFFGQLQIRSCEFQIFNTLEKLGSSICLEFEFNMRIDI